MLSLTCLTSGCRQFFGRSDLLLVQINRFFVAKMSNWEAEKQKFLSMSADDKIQYYSAKNIHKIKDIPTWVEYAKEQKSLPDKIPKLSENKIDFSKNALANKISVFKGDITTLEVST